MITLLQICTPHSISTKNLKRNTIGAVQYALCLPCIICMISSRPRLELQPHGSHKAWRDISIDNGLAAVNNAAGKAMELATRIGGQMFKF